VREKCVPIYLTSSDYDRLEQRAAAVDRGPIQQARWIVRRWLATEAAEATPDPSSEAVAEMAQ
jgi:hypothetical protein